MYCQDISPNPDFQFSRIIFKGDSQQFRVFYSFFFLRNNLQIYKNKNVFVCIYVGLHIFVILIYTYIYHKLFYPAGTHTLKCPASSYLTQKYTLETLLCNHGKINFSPFNSAEYSISSLIYLSSPLFMDIYFYLFYYKQSCCKYPCLQDFAHMCKCICNVNFCKRNYQVKSHVNFN